MNAADVMVSNVITVRSDTSVEEIAAILLANRISAVPVIDEAGALVGIISEGDLIRRAEVGTERHRSWWLELLTVKQTLTYEFIKSHARKAADLMTRRVISVKPQTPLNELASLLEKHRIKRVPVVDGGKIVGIVSRANLVQALVSHGHKITPDEIVADSALHDRLLTRLRSQPWWSDGINVVVHDGTVELWGIVESEVEKDAIRVAVEVTPGVRNISNNLAVSSNLQQGM